MAAIGQISPDRGTHSRPPTGTGHFGCPLGIHGLKEVGGKFESAQHAFDGVQ